MRLKLSFDIRSRDRSLGRGKALWAGLGVEYDVASRPSGPALALNACHPEAAAEGSIVLLTEVKILRFAQNDIYPPLREPYY